jgi:ferredoxin-NADP reductase
MPAPNSPPLRVVAGGVGFTPMAPFLSALLDPVRRAAAVPGLRRLVVVWAVQELAHLGWFAVSWGGGFKVRRGYRHGD